MIAVPETVHLYQYLLHHSVLGLLIKAGSELPETALCLFVYAVVQV